MSKERDYLRAVNHAAAAVNSEIPLKEKLDEIIKSTARAARSGASLILLDATKTKLVHTASWRLPYFFLQKGLIDPDKSLLEVITGKPVAISDVANDKRIQYPEMVRKATIQSPPRHSRNAGRETHRRHPALFAGDTGVFRSGYQICFDNGRPHICRLEQ